jgi:transcriptional regulator with XRE-family HTH domain
MSDEIARHLVAARARLGLTQGQFAARLGVSQGAVSRWETGRHRPSPEILTQLGVPPVPPAPAAVELRPGLLPSRLGRPRLRLRPLDSHRRRLTDHLEDGFACAARTGRREIAAAIQAMLERCLLLESREAKGRRATDRPLS